MKVIDILKKYDACVGAIQWANGRTPKQAWGECNRGDWLVWIAVKLGIDREIICAALVEIVRPVLRYIPDGEDRPNNAIDTLEKWTLGEATIEEVKTAASAAYTAYTAYTTSAAYTTYAAAAAAAAAYASAASAAAAAAYASAASAASAAAADTGIAQKKDLQQSADTIRKHIPWKMIREKLKENESMSTLKPCPFCGGEAHNYAWRYGTIPTNISCGNRHCCGSRIIATKEEWDYRTIEDVLRSALHELMEAGKSVESIIFGISTKEKRNLEYDKLHKALAKAEEVLIRKGSIIIRKEKTE